jgi:hypothetical protein
MRATTKTTLASKVASTKTVPAPSGQGTTAKTKTNGAAKEAAPTKIPAAVTQPVPAPPAWVFPTAPNGFVPPTADAVRRRSKPTEQMRAEGEDFATELRNGTTYAEDFGKRAPDPIAMAAAVDIATQWDAIYNAAAPVAEYALAMRGAAWDVALKPVKKLQTAYEVAVADEPSLAKTWRQTAAFFGAREEPAQRAVQTKVKAKKAAKKKAKAAGNGAPAKS